MTAMPARSLATALWIATIGLLVTSGVIEVALARTERADLAGEAAGTVAFSLAITVIASVGALAAARSVHRAAFLLLVIALVLAGSFAASSYSAYGVLARPGELAGAKWVTPFGDLLFFLVYPLIAVLFLITPTGKPDARWRTWCAAVALIAAGGFTVASVFGSHELESPLDGRHSPYAIGALDGAMDVLLAVSMLLSAATLLAAIVSLPLRFRRAAGVERQQLRWVGFGAGCAVVLALAAVAAGLLEEPGLRDFCAFAAVGAFGVAITVAVSRYRLYDLDRLVTRSLVYAVLAVVVAAAYAAVVVLLGAIAGSGHAASVVATVVAALVALPLRSWIQGTIDRLLFGSRSDPFGTVATLSRELQGSASPAEALHGLVQTVASQLRLPYVAIEGPDGAVLEHTGNRAERVERFEPNHQGEPRGQLVLALRRGEEAFSMRERALLEDLARHAGSVVQSVALVRDLQRSRGRLVSAQHEERRRLRRDLHDGLGPQLTAVTLKADAALNFLAGKPERTEALLVQLRADTTAALEDVRRLVYGLRPPALDEHGLIGALRDYVSRMDSHGQLKVRVDGELCSPLPAAVEVAAYRIATEAITNAVRHSGGSCVEVRVALDRELAVTVQDDGHGMQAERPAGVGIASMRERAAELGGTVTLRTEPGSGLAVVARLPVEVT